MEGGAGGSGPFEVLAARLPQIKTKLPHSAYDHVDGFSTPADGERNVAGTRFSTAVLAAIVITAAYLFLSTTLLRPSFEYSSGSGAGSAGTVPHRQRQLCAQVVRDTLGVLQGNQGDLWRSLQSSACAIKPSPDPARCSNVRVILGIMSEAKDVQRRAWIRETWKSYSNVYHHQHNPSGSILVVFAIGLPNSPLDSDEAAFVADEALIHRDLWLLDIPENMNEGKTAAWYQAAWERYGSAAAAAAGNAASNSSSRKILGGAASRGRTKWKEGIGGALPAQDVQGCPGLQWVGKADQDSYIRTVALEKAMDAPEMAPKSTYWGYMVKCSSCTPSEFKVPTDAVDVRLAFGFATGMLQMLSADLAAWVGTSPITTTWSVGKEDVNVGYWLARGEHEGQIAYRIVNDRRFHDWAKGNETWWAYRKPTPDSLVIHKTYTQAEFQALHAMYPDSATSSSRWHSTWHPNSSTEKGAR